ncbi:FHA domain-containing protein [Salinibacterium sp. dk2585]|uniref:FHA domain-containing protein n=1 Tax=unclassified Salinibacterium TaxID=2632331 RepID=UPI0011C249FB|nr:MULTISPECIES: FHA domain-containing protein [unclassified Salinibacterium]QEE61731.1 FHA domain-containing protein [Salinibacterium sp. dk2585]TXK54714.1 FHA domain-containing protein [Salinibacterium sp. dk5596]
MERDVEDTVIRPSRSGALDTEPDDADTRLVTRLRPPAVEAQPLGVATPHPDAATRSSSQGTDAPQESPAPNPAVASTYRFTVNSHEPIELDRPAHIGRRPSLPRVPQRVRPRLVRVPSPKQEVSSTHLEVRQEGASVVLTDLRSTNGTTVTMPGATPRALRPGESLVVTPGTVVDIGDGNVLEILPLQRTTGERSMIQGAPQ